MENKQNNINNTANITVWFEIVSIDFDRSVTFYETILDVKIDKQDMKDLKMGLFPHDDLNTVSGSIICGMGFKPSENGSIVYLNGGQDLTNVLSKVEDAGGKIVIPKTHLGENVGYIAHFIDTEGNRIGLHSMN